MLGVLLGLAAASQALPPERVSLGLVATDPRFWERAVETCGAWRNNGEGADAVLYVGEGSDSVAILVSRSLVPAPPAEDAPTCLTGVFRRRDGVPVSEAVARGLLFGFGSHYIRTTSLVFYPTAVRADPCGGGSAAADIRCSEDFDPLS